MKKITKLTPEQIARMGEFRDRWIKIGLATEPADRPRAEAAVAKMYEGAGLAVPKIVWCSSPLAMGLTRGFILKAISDPKLLKKVGDSVGASVWASVRDGVRASVRDSVWDSVGASVGDSVRASVRASVWASVWASVRDSVGDGVWASVGDSVGASVGDSVYGQHEAGWLSFYEFFSEVCALTKQTEKLSGLWELARSAGWALPHQGMCWVSERHCIVKQDEQRRIHCVDGPAIKYPDGWAIYAVRGVRVPGEWIEDKKTLTPEIALTWKNVEQRRVACEILGWHHILTALNARTIDKDGDPEIGELVEVDLPDSGRERFLRVKCGTGRLFALPVPKDMATALQANAWTYGFDDVRTFFKPEVRT